jgi:hypothetical protein
MSSIGGFLPLEIPVPTAADPYHAAVPLASGRACWHVVLRTCRPRRVLLPFYVCDAILQPLATSGTPHEFYPITDAFRPADDRTAEAGELMLLVNYFGAMASFVGSSATRDPDRIVVDDTQAFFRRGHPDRWSFNSARKFFGVPDGGYLYGPAVDVETLPPSDTADCDHLLARLAGEDARAWEQFKQHEARIGIEPRAMSAVSARLLGGVDMAHARRCRQANFEALHRHLGPLNLIGLPLERAAEDAPMCYPFLPARDVDKTALGRRGVFVPTLWPEIESRPEDGFEWERVVARRLLPLPIDHRYGPCEMDTLAQTLLQVLQ